MIEPTWDLSLFYKGFDDPALDADIAAFVAAAQDFQALLSRDLPDGQKLEEAVQAAEKLYTLMDRVMLFVSLSLEADHNNAQALRYMDELSQKMVEANLVMSAFARYAATVPELEAKSPPARCSPPTPSMCASWRGKRIIPCPPIWKSGCSAFRWTAATPSRSCATG